MLYQYNQNLSDSKIEKKITIRILNLVYVRLSTRSVFPSRFSIASRTISRERPWSNIYIERTRNHSFANKVLPRCCIGVNDWERKGMISLFLLTKKTIMIIREKINREREKGRYEDLTDREGQYRWTGREG